MIETIQRNFAESKNELVIGGLPISSLAEQYGTPLFAYDEAVLRRQWTRLRSALTPRFQIHYSVKANPNQRFLRFFLDQGAGLEIASGGELYQALAAGADPARILFAGPGKTDDEITYAVRTGIRELHVESFGELERTSRIARSLSTTARIGLRINPDGEMHGAAMRMGGRASAFGVDESDVASFVRRTGELANVRLCGVHLFIGTQILDHEFLITQYRNAVRLAKQVAAQTGNPLDTLDFGGGLGIPYFAHEQPLDLESIRNGVAALSDELAADPLLAKTRCVVEPGRFLVAESGVYVTRVTEVKHSRGKTFVVLDGGMNHHLAASGNLGQTIKRNYPIAVLNKLDQPSDATAELVGPLCTPLDVIGRAISLPRIEVGDLVGVFQSGAYARTSSPHGFLSHPAPPELWVSHGRVELIRRRGTFHDNLRDQTIETSGLCVGSSSSSLPLATVQATDVATAPLSP